MHVPAERVWTMDGEQNGQRSGGAGEEGVAAGQPGAEGSGSAAGGGGDGAGSSGTSGAGGGDAAGDGSSVAGGGAEAEDLPGPITLNWASSEEDAEAAITWARYHPTDPQALKVLEALANNQSLGIRNGDTPVRRSAQTALRDLKTTLGVQ
jgi:hypothetical protein